MVVYVSASALQIICIIVRSSPSNLYIKNIIGHSLHKRGVQRQKGFETFVSNQERRAILDCHKKRQKNIFSAAGFVPP